MPAASTKLETKVSADYQEPMKFVLLTTDKKVRNLEKRKGKLDLIREKATSGIPLEKDQKDALDKYDEVITNLESARDFQKVFLAYNLEVEKWNKKQAKREKIEQQAAEKKRFQKLIQYQSILDSFGSEDVREHFKTGKYGAVVLTEDNLKQFDDLYALINPSRDDSNESGYEDKTVAASEHIICLLDAKEREIVGTTYKDIAELLELISKCGYFESCKNVQEEPETVTSEAVEEMIAEPQVEGEDVQHITEEPEPSSLQNLQSLESTLPELPVQQLEPETQGLVLDNVPQSGMAAHSFMETPYSQPRPRPLQEIVSSVQGNFNFLQESQIDLESPHNDPAVVIAQPMVRSSLNQPADPSLLPSQTYTNSSFMESSNALENVISTHSDNTSQQLLGSVPSSTVPQVGLDFSHQSYSQVSKNQHVGNCIFGEDSTQISHTMRSQNVGDSSQFELQQSLPVSQTQDNPGEKKFTMNVSAPVFQSMYSQTLSHPGQPDHREPSEQNPANPSLSSEFADVEFQGDIEGNGYPNNGFQQIKGGRGSLRGGNRSRGNISNGYNNRPGPGNNGRGGRGGSFGYPRNDYRPEGYQGYNGGGYNNQASGQGFQKRGGSGNGQARGGTRSGNTASRGLAPRSGGPGYVRPASGTN